MNSSFPFKEIIIALYFSFLSFFSLKAQTYLPFPDSAAIWVNTHYIIDWGAGNPMPDIILTGVHNYCISGEDTVINNLEYSKINWCNGPYKGALRNHAGKVFYVPNDSLNEFKLYDFTINPGDTLKDIYLEGFFGFGMLYDFIIGQNAIDTIVINGASRRRIFLDNGHWIEGIGNTQGLFLDPWANVSNYLIELHCMSYRDSSLFPSAVIGKCPLDVGIIEIVKKDKSLQGFPNPTDGIVFLFDLDSGIKPSQLKLMDMKGQLISPPITIQGDQAKIDLRKYEDGMYFAQIRIGNSIRQTKIILIK